MNRHMVVGLSCIMMLVILKYCFGYVEAGHGYKHWLISYEDIDVKDMYHIYECKKEILLWSTQADHQRKRAHFTRCGRE